MEPGTIAGFRLSPQQEHLWLLQQAAAPTPYRSQCAILLEGRLDEGRLKKALGDVVNRHEILRTTFHAATQLIHEVCDQKFQHHDFSGLPGDQQQSKIEALFEEMKQAPIDLTRLPLLQTTLVTLSPDRSSLLLGMPALCGDAAMFRSLMLELATTYAKEPLANEPMQYADLAEWQNELLETAETDIGKEFWRKQNLVNSRLDREEADFTPQVFSLTLRSRTLAKLRALAELYDASTELILLTCWQILLWRLADQTDVTVAAAFDGRTDEELEDALGLLTKYLPLQGALEDNDRFDAVLETLSQTHAESKKWQQAFNWHTVNSYFPFCFEFSSQNKHQVTKDLSWSIVKQYACVDRFRLKLSCLEREDSLTLEFHYDASSYAASEVKQRADQFQKLLEGVINEPHGGISEFEIVTADEWRRLIFDFNRTAVEFPADKCIQHVFEARVAEAPEQTAIVHQNDRVTYAELNRRANKVANYLRELGVGPETLVGICMERGIELVAGLLGILKAGGAYVPFDPDYPIERLAVMLSDAQVPVLLTQEPLLDNLPTGAAFTVLIDSDWDAIDGYDDQNPRVEMQADNAAYVIYTSGTTGKPKGVVVEHSGVINLAQWQADNFGITAASRVSQFASYSFDAAVGESFMALLNGATLVMLNRENLSPAELIQSINEHEINVCVMVPSVLKELDPEKLTNGKRLSVVAVGEVCSPELALKWLPRCNFMNAYGPTEYTVYSHLWKVAEARVEALGCVPIGTPIHNAGTYILDPHLNPVPIGVSGEIYIAGPGIARGYLNHPDLTAQKFIPNRFEPNYSFTDAGAVDVNVDRERFVNEIVPLHLHQNGNGSSPISQQSVLDLIEDLDDDLIERTRVFMKTYDADSASYQGFCRYLIEGAHDSYASCGINDEVLRLLFGCDDLNGLQGVDFGFGNTEIMQALQRLGASVVGLDFNPFFVQKGRSKKLGARMAKIDVPPPMFTSETGLERDSQDFAISTLVLDRLEKPRNLIENVFLVLKDDGRFAIQTLLPIVGVDDGEVEHPIVYTPEPDRIATGEDSEQDKLSLISLLHSFGARDVKVYRLPYIVTSRDGIQEYTVWSFAGRKRNGHEVAGNRRSRMYKTGDRGRYLPDGNIEFRGRTDNQVKIRGFRIELDDIESALREYHAVKDCVVTTSAGPDGAPRIATYVVTENRATEVDELQAYLKKKLPVHMIPSAFVILDQLPLMPSGKLDRQALPTPEQYQATRKINYVAPRTPTEELLATVWADMLKLERVSVYDNFFDLGGHSLLATQVLSRLRQMFGVELLLRDMFKQPTIAGFAETIERERGAKREAVLPLRAVSRDRRLPLSFAQQRLWFINRMEPDSLAYNVPISLRLTGRLQVNVLERTLSEVVRRHESLRTGFALSDGETEPVQVINEAQPVKVPLVDLSEVAAQDAELSQLLRDDATRGFNLDEESPLRVTLLRLSEMDHVVLFTMHHIVSDGWSMGVLVKEVAALYEAFAAGKPSPLPELSIQYADFAVWQREWLQGDVLEKQLTYWRGQLAGAPGTLELPSDYVRPAEPSFRGAHEALHIPAELLQKLKSLGRREGTTLFMTLLAAWQTLLSRYSGQSDIVVGTPIANRNRAETENLIGFFVNVIVLRTDLSGNPTFQELLGRVREVALEAYAHQDLPFEKLVEELQPERRWNHMPVFQVAFELQNAPMEDLTLKDLQISALPNGTVAPKIDLTLSAMERDDALEIVFTYNRDLFTEQTIKRMQKQFEVLLAGVVANPSSRLSDVPLSSDEDREALSTAFSEAF